MDITNNVSSINEEIKQEGGDYNDKKIDSSSDFDVSSIDIDSIFSENDINNILGGADIDFDAKNFNLSELEKNPSFNKLSSNQKTLVINRILEKLPKGSKQHKPIDTSAGKESYFYCKSCGYYEKIPNKMFIFSKGNEVNDDMCNYRFLNFKHDNTLPYTKKYTCINSNCSTHKNENIKMAVFYRQRGSYNTRYVCSVCNSFWNTFIEK
jgi:hypothetical protein